MKADALDIEHVLAGYRMRLTGDTLHAAVAALADRGVTRRVIADRCGISERHVTRLLAEMQVNA